MLHPQPAGALVRTPSTKRIQSAASAPDCASSGEVPTAGPGADVSQGVSMSTVTSVINATLSRSASGIHLARDRQRALRAEGASPGEAALGLVRAVFLAGGVPEDNDFSIHVS